MQEWRVYSKKADFKAIGSRFGIDQVAARIIRNRDIADEAAIDYYLNGTLSQLHDPSLMKDMDKAVDIIGKCIERGDRIRIIGDYDIDGICSIYILFKGLIRLGADVDYDVPDRITDGYGLNENLIKKAYDQNRNVIITCDNGIAAIEQVRYAKELNMTVVVTDHHEPQYTESDNGRQYYIPEADAVVDPKRADCSYPFKSLCGAGIAYKLIQKLYQMAGLPDDSVEEFIEFAGIATVGDIVDLIDENRIIVKYGLKALAHTANYGLRQLMSLNGIDSERVSAYHIGFVIGPCLNASGRLDTASKALAMLLANTLDEADSYAVELKMLNDERKKLTENAVELAVRQVEELKLEKDRILLLYIPQCHESIAGIVAGRIRERYYRPAIVLTDAAKGVKGSARSIVEYNIFEGLMECADILEQFGGHAMAAGLSLKKENIEPLRLRLNEGCTLTPEDLIEKVWIDVPMPVEYITEAVIRDIGILAPFGKGNPKPVFADKGIIIRSVAGMGKSGNFTRLCLEKDNGCIMEAVGFFPPEELRAAYGAGKRIACTYYPEINEYRGNKKMQICITGYKIE